MEISENGEIIEYYIPGSGPWLMMCTKEEWEAWQPVVNIIEEQKTEQYA